MNYKGGSDSLVLGEGARLRLGGTYLRVHRQRVRRSEGIIHPLLLPLIFFYNLSGH